MDGLVRLLSQRIEQRYLFPQKNEQPEIEAGEEPDEAEIHFRCANPLEPPEISIYAYIKRLVDYAHVSSLALVHGIIYLSWLKKMRPRFHISRLTIHRVLLVAILVATKYCDDVFEGNQLFARIGGLNSVQELNRLEVIFLDELLEWRLYIAPASEAYDNILTKLERGPLAC